MSRAAVVAVWAAYVPVSLAGLALAVCAMRRHRRA